MIRQRPYLRNLRKPRAINPACIVSPFRPNSVKFRTLEPIMYASRYGASFKCDKDKALIKRIMAWMRKHEYHVWSVTGCLSDIWAGVNGRIIRIEVKVGKGKLPNRAQMEERLQNEPDGYLGQYLFVHSFQEFMEQIAPLHNLRNHKDG